MKITVKKTLDVTPALEEYIENKLAPLAKFIKHFDEKEEAELWLEVSRTTQHHKKGEEIFMAIADLKLSGTILRSEAGASDIRKAIDEVREMLHMEIEKYKTKHSRIEKREK